MRSETPVRNWLQLSLANGLGPILIRRLIELTGSAQGAARASVGDLQQVEGIGLKRAGAIRESLKAAESAAEAQLELSGKMGSRIICPDDADYPELLHLIPDPPAVLYISGTLEPRDLQSLAIVGSRRCTHYGREQAERFAGLLAGAGFTIISGGARGIDSASHRGALQHPHGRTIAVLGSGLDVPYPPENKALFAQIAERGAVIGEFPFGTAPAPENFPRRNRIVSGLARGVLVVEADLRSGALITARLANEDQGRPVFALPGRVDSATSAGPHQLIRDGAILAGGLEDIIAGLDPLPDSVRKPELFEDAPRPEAALPAERGAAEQTAVGDLPPGLSASQQRLLGQIGVEPAPVERLIERTGLEAAVVLQELTMLSLKGMVRRIDGQTYVRQGRR